ncbi:MAG: Uma2 family endonuclease, partial [Prochlorothrix sp.]
MVTLNLPQPLTDETFQQLCHHNPTLRLERTTHGELIAMTPAGSESGRQNLSISAQLWYWNQNTQLGVTFDSSAGFTLPNGAIRSPDAAWIEKSRWEAIPPVQRQQFAPICPDFV